MQAITHAQIEPTTRCNFTCGFCAGRSMPQGDLSWDHFVRFLDAHPRLDHVELQGEGEPMLHARFFDMVDECDRRGIRFGIITNGSLLSPGSVDRLLSTAIASVHVSMESSDPAQFASIRGGLFSKVREGLARLVERRGELELARPVVGLAVTILKDTIGAIDDIHRLYDELGLDGGIIVQPLQTMPAYRRRYGRAMADQLIPQSLAARFAAIRQDLAQTAPVARVEDFFYFSLFAGFRPESGTCPWLENGAYLAQDGRVTGCCFMKDSSFGELDDPESLERKRADMRAALAAGVVPDDCTGCAIAARVTARR